MSATHMQLPQEPSAIAPDGSQVRVLLSSRRGGMAHFRFAPGGVTPAVRHRTVDELWYVVSGHAEMWTNDGQSEQFRVSPGSCVVIAVGTAFQVRSGIRNPWRWSEPTIYVARAGRSRHRRRSMAGHCRARTSLSQVRSGARQVCEVSDQARGPQALSILARSA